MSDDWTKASAAAAKILGKDAKIPDLPSTIGKADADYDKANGVFNKVLTDLDKAILDLDNANSAYVNAWKQFRGQVEKSDFNLDEKKAEDKKKVQQAEKILTAAIDKISKTWIQDEKVIDELDKHANQLGKYKPVKS